VPGEGPFGIDFDLKFMEEIAKTAARLWPDLAPCGGTRWTAEDVSWAVSELYVEFRTERFARAVARARSRESVANYLLKALRNRLIKRAKRLRRFVLLDGVALDALPARKGAIPKLQPMDRAVLIERAYSALTLAERATAAAYFEKNGTIVEHNEAKARANRRHRTRLHEVLQRIVSSEGLSEEEAREITIALAAKLTGGGAVRTAMEFVSGFRGHEDC
jgi:hypothetical protein